MSIWRSAGVVLVLQCLGTPDAAAQIVTDGSMGPAANLVGPDFLIGEALGTRFGSNLFHSFTDFNVQQGQSATFTSNFAGLTSNVISRVTGGNPSLIDGLLRSEIVGADFWFINPNGLVFGQNAVLDVPAGFYASTADLLELDDGGTFRATNPGASSLTVAPPSAFGFLDATVGSINVNGAQLSVGAGATLALVGGAQTLSSAMVAAPSGRVDLVAVASAGTVQATAAPGEALGISGFTDLATIELQSSRIDVDTAGSATAGSIGIVGQSIGILGGSLVTAGSLSTAANAGDAGQIAIQTAHETFIEDSSILARSRTGQAGTIEIDSRFVTVLGGYVEAEATDNLSGAVNIETESLSVALEAGIRSGDVVNVTGGGSVTLFIGRIDAVELNFEVDSLSMDEGSAMGSTAAGVQAQFTLTGADGGIASDVSLRNESFIAAATTITTHDMTVGNEASIGATGAPIVLNVDRLFMTSGGSIGVGSQEGVDGGSVLIRGASANAAELVSIHGVGEFGGRSSIDTGAGVNPFIGDAGNGGDITIIARTLELSEDARITSNASSLGSGGNILLQVDSLTMSGGAVITSGTGAFGDAGDVTIRGATAPAAVLVALDGGDGEDGTGIFSSSTFQDRGPGGPQGIAGAAGDISITADEIRLTSTAFGIPLIDASTVEGPGGSISLGVGTLTVSGGFIQASTTGPGDAGSISIAGTDGGAADLIVLSFLPSEITTSSLPASSPFWTAEDAGDAGSIDIAAREIQVLGGSTIASQTFGGGAGGSISVQVDQLTFSGESSRITVGTTGSGDAGDIVVDGIDGAPAGSIEVSGFSSGLVTASSRIFGSPPELGDAGNISIRADSISLSDLATLDAHTSGGSGGTIDIGVGALSVTDGAGINAQTSATGDAGEIVIHGVDGGRAGSVIVAGVSDNPSAGGLGARITSTSVASGPDAGAAGNIVISAESVAVSDGGFVRAETVDGQGGTISMDVGQLSVASDGLVSTSVLGDGTGGSIDIEADGLVLLEGGQITAQSTDTGPTAGSAGNVSIAASELRLSLAEAGESAIDASTVDGAGGSIALALGSLTIEGGAIQASTSGSGAGGSIDIDATDVLLEGGQIVVQSTAAGSTAGAAGDISITAAEVRLAAADGGTTAIDASTVDGAGGSIALAVDSLTIEGGAIQASTTGSGAGGSIDIDATEVLLEGGQIVVQSTAAGASAGAAGNVAITASDLRLGLAEVGESTIDASTVDGTGGSIALAVGTLTMEDGSIQASTSGSGDGGSIVIDATDVLLEDGQIVVQSTAAGSSAGSAGDISITAADVRLAPADGSTTAIDASTVDGAGGSIVLAVGSLTLEGGSIQASTSGSGDGGSIVIDATDVQLEGGQIIVQSTAAGSSAGSAGNISIAAAELHLGLSEVGESTIDASTVDGTGGSIALAVGSLTMEDGSIQASTSGSGNGGSIDIDATDVLLEGGQIVVQSTATGSSAGSAGDISITAADVRLAPAAGSTTAIDASTVDGAGGSIALAVDTLSIEGGAIQASTSGSGEGGSIAIEATGTVLLDSGLLLAESTGTGASGSVSIAADELRLQDGAAISVRSTGAGRAGSVFTDLGSLIMIGHSQIDATATSSLAGNVELNVSEVALLQDSVISGLSADPENDGGNFIIQQPAALILQRSSILANSASGTGGNISITADAIVLDTESTVEATGEVLTVGQVLGSVIQLDPPVVVDAAAALDTRCTSQQSGERSSMVVHATPAGAVREPYLPADASVAPISCRQ